MEDHGETNTVISERNDGNWNRELGREKWSNLRALSEVKADFSDRCIGLGKNYVQMPIPIF